MSEMRSFGPGENSPGLRYLSLENINAAHIKLLQRSKDPDNPELMDEVERYVASVCAAGAILDADADRDAAQKLVTYWSNTLYRAEREPKETLLEEFNEEECPDLPNDKCPYRTLETGGERLPTGPPGLLRLTRECLRLLEHDHIVAVVGQSGGSRGFLIFEGVLPKLSAGAIEGSADWRVIEFTPFADPLRELVAAILPETVGAEGVSRQCDLFRKDSGVLKQLLDHSGEEPALLIVNRFENFFNVSRDDASSFFHNLQMLVESRKHCVILKVRSDYLSQVASDSTLSRLLERNQLLLAFTPQELRQLVEEPAKLVGLHFETGLVDRLVQDVMGDPRALQLLRFTLLQLWDHRVRNRITWESYRKLGGGRVAVEKTAERIFLQQVSDRPVELLSSIWTAFIRLNVGRDVSFLAVRREDLHREVRSNKSLSALSAETIDKTLDELVVANLLNQKRGDRSKDDSFSIAQASLPSCWPRMGEWIEEKREINRRWLRVRSAADQWHSSNELPVLLWGGSALEEAERDPKLQLPEFALVKNFTKASRRFVERNRLRRNGLWAFFACSLATFFGICWFYSVSVETARANLETARANLEEQKKEAMAKQNDLSMLQKDLSMLQLSAASTLFGEEANNAEARERDPSAAFVWYSKAHDLLKGTKTGLNEPDRKVVMDNYSSRLAFAFREAPRLLHCIPQTKLGLATMSKNGKWALTVNLKEAKIREVNLWDLESANSKPQPIIKHNDKVWPNIARFSADSKFLVTGERNVKESNGEKSVLRLWPLSKSGNLPYSAEGDWDITGQLGDLVAIQADGKRLLAIARNKDAKESSSSDGTKSNDPKPKSSWSVYLVNVESDGRRNDPQFVKTFESATPACPVTSLEFSAAGNKFLVAANNPGNEKAVISIWESNDLTKEPKSIPLDFQVNFACFVRHGTESSEDNYVLSCCGKEDANSGEAVLSPILSTNNSIQEELFRHNGRVVHASVSSDQQRVVTACHDNKAHILDLKKIRMDPGFATLLSHPANVSFTAFSPNGLLVATACRDQKVRIWNASNAKLLYTFECGGTPVQLVFSDDGCRLFAQAGNDKALVWDLLTDALPAKTIRADGGISHAVFDETLHSLVTVQELVDQNTDREVQVWNVVDDGTTKPKWDFKIDWNLEIEAMAVGPKGGRVAICGKEEVRLYRDSSNEPVLVKNPCMVVRNVCFSHDGSKVLVAGNNNLIDLEGTARVWSFDDDLNVTHVSDIRESKGESIGELKYVCFSPDAQRVLTCGGTPNSANSAGSIRGEAIVWGINTNPATRIQKLTKPDNDGKSDFQGHDAPILFGAFSFQDKGRYVVTTSVDDTACIWNSENGGAPLYTLGRETSTQYHTADVVSAAFVPNEINKNEINQVVTVGKDGRAILWDWKSKKSHVLKADGNPLKGVFFSKDGRYFLTTSAGTKARVWDRLVAMSHMSDSSDSSTNVSPQVAVLEHSGPIIAGGVHPDDPNRFLTLNSVGTARMSDAATSTLTSKRTVTNRGVQIKYWNLNPVDDESMPVLRAASTALAQRKVNSKSQTLEKISPKDIENVDESLIDSKLKRELRWNQCEADNAEVEGYWHAAEWHLGQLIKLGGPSPKLEKRQIEAKKRR